LVFHCKFLDFNAAQNMAKPPLSIPPTTTSPLTVTLIIGSPKHSPLKIDLFDLTLPESHPAAQHPDEASFHPLPMIEHTFRAPQKLPPRPISALFAGVTLAPWAVLLALVRLLNLIVLLN
jgi:oligosaccharyltransferase complex subunit delta (ribophorin II)